MKTLKNDTRYIIKRVLIGVLIAIVLFNARKCGVYALTSSQAYCRSGSTNDTITKCNIDSSTFYAEIDDNIRISQFYGNPYGNDIWNKIIIALKNKNNGDYIVFLDVNSIIPTTANVMGFKQSTSYTNVYNLRYYSSQNEDVAGANNMSYIYITTDQTRQNSVSSNAVLYYYPNQNIKTTVDGLYFVSGDGNGVNYDYINPTDWEYVSVAKNLLPNLEIDNIKYYYTNNTNTDSPLVGQFPPSGYSELSLKDYQGVVFVPKNYDNIQCSVVGDLCNTTFDYYYQEEIKEAYFPLDNRFNIRFNSDFLNSPNEPSELKSTYFPISQVSVNETFYYAFMIYNYTNDGSPLDPNNYYAYGDAKVWYDSTLWNYYLVEDFNEWSANVCYILNGDEVCTTISGLPTLKDAIEQAQLEQNILGTHVGDLNLFSSILRFPLGFVQSLSTDSCTALQLPSLPFIGGNISLPCMSLIYQQVLGIYQPVISGFINFIIIYYLILAIIKFYNRTFDPSKQEIEVIDL